MRMNEEELRFLRLNEKEKQQYLDAQIALASTERGVASIVKNDRYYEPSATPTPRTGDLLTDLCTRASREVEALRLIDEVQKQHITNLEAELKGVKELNAMHKDVAAERVALNNDLRELVKKSEEVISKQNQIMINQEKEIETLKKQKCGIWCKAMIVLTGVGVGIILK